MNKFIILVLTVCMYCIKYVSSVACVKAMTINKSDFQSVFRFLFALKATVTRDAPFRFIRSTLSFQQISFHVRAGGCGVTRRIQYRKRK